MLKNIVHLQIESLAPYNLKSARQSARLATAGRMTGLSAEFAIPQANNPFLPVIIFGSGASVLDFDFEKSIPEEAITIAVNDAVFLRDDFQYFSFEKGLHDSDGISDQLLNEHMFGPGYPHTLPIAGESATSEGVSGVHP